MVARTNRWSLGATARVSLLASIGHVAVSLVLGLVLAAAGLAIRNSVVAEEVPIVGGVLVLTGIGFLVWALRSRGHAHPHPHPHPHPHDHGHDHGAAPTADAAHGAGGAQAHDHGPDAAEHGHAHPHDHDHAHPHGHVHGHGARFGPCRPVISVEAGRRFRSMPGADFGLMPGGFGPGPKWEAGMPKPAAGMPKWCRPFGLTKIREQDNPGDPPIPGLRSWWRGAWGSAWRRRGCPCARPERCYGSGWGWG